MLPDGGSTPPASILRDEQREARRMSSVALAKEGCVISFYASDGKPSFLHIYSLQYSTSTARRACPPK